MMSETSVRAILSDMEQAIRQRAESAYIELAKKLGAENIDALDESHEPTILTLVSSGWDNEKALQALIELGASLHYRNEDGGSLLHEAARGNSPKMITMLVENGLNPNHKDTFSHQSPLFECSSKQSVRALLSVGADHNSTNIHGHTPIFECIHPEVARALMEGGADIEYQSDEDDECLRPLHLLSIKKVNAVIAVLVECGANIDAQDTKGKTPLMHALSRCHDETALQLIKAGASVSLADEDGIQPIHRAADRGCIKSLAELVQNKGVDIHTQSPSGQAAIHLAASTRHNDSVKFLLSAGADLNALCNMGKTPLHYAAQYGQIENVKALIEAGASMSARDKGNLDPKGIAKACGNDAVYDYIASAQASMEIESMFGGAQPSTPSRSKGLGL